MGLLAAAADSLGGVDSKGWEILVRLDPFFLVRGADTELMLSIL